MPRHTPKALTKLKPHLSLQELAENTGISLSYLSLIFRGRRNPSLEKLRKIAGSIGCTTARLSRGLNGANA